LNERKAANEMTGPNPSTELGVSLTETLRRSDLSTVASELAEVALDDAVLAEGVWRDVPILGTVVGLWRIGVTVRDYVFIKKLSEFLRALEDVPAAQRSAMIDKLEREPEYGRKVGEELILLLDRLDSVNKAGLMGRAFRAYCQGAFDISTLERLNHCLDRILLRDLSRLPEFLADERRMDDITKQAFVNVGLAYMPVGSSSTEVNANRELCAAMIEHVLTPSDADLRPGSNPTKR
jgi:hypothetical protein